MECEQFPIADHMADQFTHTGKDPPASKTKMNPSILKVLPPESPVQPDLVPRFEELDFYDSSGGQQDLVDCFVDLNFSNPDHVTTTTHDISSTQSTEGIPNSLPNVVPSGVFGLAFSSYDQDSQQHQEPFYSMPQLRQRLPAGETFQDGPSLKLFVASCDEDATLKKSSPKQFDASLEEDANKSPPLPACLYSIQEQTAIPEGPKKLYTQEPVKLRKTFEEGKVVLGTTEALLVEWYSKLGKTTGVICDEIDPTEATTAAEADQDSAGPSCPEDCDHSATCHQQPATAHLITVVESLADKTLDQLPKYPEQCMVDLNVHMDEHFSRTMESSHEQSCKGPGIEALGSYCDESKHMSFTVLLVMKHSATEEYWKFFIKVFDDKYKCDGDIFDTNLDSFVAYIPAKAPDTPDDLKGPIKTISVGSAYQASVPEGLCMYGDAPAYENKDRLRWDPSRMNDSEVEKYLEEIHLQCLQAAIGVNAVPTGAHVGDDEQALYLLLQCGHNKEEALRRRKMQAIPASDPMSLWSEEECSNFKTGFRFYGKDFYMIHQNKVKTRSVGELVQFYYLWKKSEKHDIFANKTRLDKQRYTLHPGVTDYMERFLDEQESSVPSIPNRERSASPVHSLLYWDRKRNHLKPPTHPDPGARGDSEKGSAFQPIHPGVDFNTSTTTIPCIMPETPIHKAAEVENIGAKNGLPEDSYIPALKKSRLDHSFAEHSVCELDKTDLSLKTSSTEAHIIKIPS